ncbi:hypothetical protein HY641_03205 [Candidatus Woesearchaeota archaeon]|nr:hypothetical protein [Candidatus Woesearchaeota archaeon]
MVNYKLLGLAFFITSGVLTSYLGVMRGGGVAATAVADIARVNTLYGVAGFWIFFLALVGTLAQGGWSSPLTQNGVGLLGDLFSRLTGSTRPPRIANASAQVVPDATAPGRFAVHLRWTEPNPTDPNGPIERIIITRIHDLRLGEEAVAVLPATANDYVDRNVQAQWWARTPAGMPGSRWRWLNPLSYVPGGRPEYLIRTERRGESSSATHVRPSGSPPADAWTAPSAPRPPGDPFEGLPAWAFPARGSPAEYWFVRDRGGGNYDDISGTPAASYAPGANMIILIRTAVDASNNASVFAVPGGTRSIGTDNIRILGAPGGHDVTRGITGNMYRPLGAIPRASGWLIIETPAPPWAAPTVTITIAPDIEVL